MCQSCSSDLSRAVTALELFETAATPMGSVFFRHLFYRNQKDSASHTCLVEVLLHEGLQTCFKSWSFHGLYGLNFRMQSPHHNQSGHFVAVPLPGGVDSDPFHGFKLQLQCILSMVSNRKNPESSFGTPKSINHPLIHRSSYDLWTNQLLSYPHFWPRLLLNLDAAAVAILYLPLVKGILSWAQNQTGFVDIWRV